MKNTDTVIGLIIIAFSALGFFYIDSLNLKSLVGLSPGVFPQFLFVLMALCGISVLLESRKTSEAISVNLSGEKLLLIILLLTAYSYALEYVGFVISTIIFLVAALYIFDEKRVKVLLAVPFLTSVLIYFMFTEFFLIPLP